MARVCCVRGCSNGTGQQLDPEARFFQFPTWKKDCGAQVEELTRRRRTAWVSAVKRKSLTFNTVSALTCVCSRHFHKGQPAYESLETDPDWAPSLHMGHSNPNRAKQRPQKKNSTDKTSLQTSETEVKVTRRRNQVTALVQNVCCVANCGGRSHNDRGQRIRNDLIFYCFPSWRRNEGVFVADLSKRRREAWVKAVGRPDISFDSVLSAARVCSRHFISGKPAYEMMEEDPDWAPSLHLDNEKPQNIRSPVKQTRLRRKKPAQSLRRSTGGQHRDTDGGKAGEVGLTEGHDDSGSAQDLNRHPSCYRRTALPPEPLSPQAPERPNALPWKHLKSRLQSLMRDKQNERQMTENTQIINDNVLDFKSFFRNALEASLESCPSSRPQPTTESHLTLDLSWISTNKSPPPVSKRPPSLCASASVAKVSCEECVRLKERILELEQKLASTEQNQTVYPEWTMPLSQTELEQQDEPSPSPEKLSPKKPKFQLNWIKRHWFLRYSPKLNVMWCHVCRLYAGKHLRHTAFVVGSRVFRHYMIIQHSNTGNHKECVKKFKARKKRMQP